MAGLTVDPVISAAVVAPGNGAKFSVGADREHNAYARNYYWFDASNVRMSLGQLQEGTALTANTTLTSSQIYGVYQLNGSGAITLTLPTPGAADQGKLLYIVCTTAHAHIVNFGGANFQKGWASAFTTATSDGDVGDNLALVVAGTGYYPQNDVTVATGSHWTLA